MVMYVHNTANQYIGGHLEVLVHFVNLIDVIHRDSKLRSQNAVETSLTGTSKVDRRTPLRSHTSREDVVNTYSADNDLWDTCNYGNIGF